MSLLEGNNIFKSWQMRLINYNTKYDDKSEDTSAEIHKNQDLLTIVSIGNNTGRQSED